MFVNIENNLVNINEIAFIRYTKVYDDGEYRPAVQIRFKNQDEINLLHVSKELAQRNIKSIWEYIKHAESNM